ncbi:hypothetical protein EHS25_000101 [Saitozyma podzolica]|uniref:Extracellular membrane protein CFEM domain-containing protein n=1 Tax=Saitozyma podzolica TaxID=1890683 RepID=A0A427YVE8_9TREE|nr:hypothetical protein EHS25_000101 [Saitozyma podzolica]
MIRHPTGIGLLTALWLLAALSRTTYATASPSTATHSWHFQRDTPSSAKITSPTTSATITSSTASPSNSTASTSNSNSTSPALALAAALLSLSPSNCTDSGGGCAVLSQYLQNATTDPEVCGDDVILSAQVCALCSPTGESVGVYNVFVRECDSEGLSNSTGTIGGGQGPATFSGYSSGSATSAGSSNSGVVVTTATALTGVVTGVITSAGSTSLTAVTSASATIAASAASASASATSVAGTASGSASSSSNTGVQANEQTSGSGSGTGSLSGMASGTIQLQTAADFAEGGTTGGTGGTVVTSGVSVSSVPSVSIPTFSAAVSAATGTGTSSNALFTAQTALSATNLSASATLSSLATQSSTAITTSTDTSALNASETFFALQVSSSCTSDCSTWQSLASSCTDDTCICTDSALTSAASCSSCVGAAGQSDALEYTIQMAGYSQYQGNCSEEATLNPSASGSSNAIEVVASAGTTYSGGSALASATGTVVAQDAEQTVVVTSSAGRRVKQWVGKWSAGRAVLLGLLWIGVVRW